MMIGSVQGGHFELTTALAARHERYWFLPTDFFLELVSRNDPQFYKDVTSLKPEFRLESSMSIVSRCPPLSVSMFRALPEPDLFRQKWALLAAARMNLVPILMEMARNFNEQDMIEAAHRAVFACAWDAFDWISSSCLGGKFVLSTNTLSAFEVLDLLPIHPISLLVSLVYRS